MFNHENYPQNAIESIENLPFEGTNQEGEPKPFIVSRDSIPSIHSVVIEGKDYFLGVLKDFRKHTKLSKHIPENVRLSISWVSLKNQEVLNTHVHPIASMIVICSGNVRSLGSLQKNLKEGDLFFIPPNTVHGFMGIKQGFWGLSIQFEDRGLYEKVDAPLVTFQNGKTSKNLLNRELNDLLKLNDSFKREFATNKLFLFLNDKANQTDDVKKKFLTLLQIWSNSFQKMVLLRGVFCSNKDYQEIANRHMEEEFGHNTSLQKEACSKVFWDPILCATADWFPWKIISLDEQEKLVLIHLVVEGSATVFYKQVPSFISQSSHCLNHFDTHQELDPGHELIGLHLLEKMDEKSYLNLTLIQKKGWRMLNQMFERIYEVLSEGFKN